MIKLFMIAAPIAAFLVMTVFWRRTGERKAQSPDATQSDAAAKCKKGDTSGVPVLEKALKDNKISLPPHA
jgi:hypothetical protein